MIDEQTLKQIIEGVLLVAGEPLSLDRLLALFPEEQRPERVRVRDTLVQLATDCTGRALELKEVASGFRYQVRQSLSTWVSQLWEERPPRYSRALLETLALIAYRQPITRAEIEDIRGVTVSTHIMKTLQEREWVRVVGHRDVPGKPGMYATTRQFLDYFNLKTLEALPTLVEIRDIDEINASLALEIPDTAMSGDTTDTTAEADDASRCASGAQSDDEMLVQGVTDEITPDTANTGAQSEADNGADNEEDDPTGEVHDTSADSMPSSSSPGDAARIESTVYDAVPEEDAGESEASSVEATTEDAKCESHPDPASAEG